MQIRSLHSLSRNERRDLAVAAADSGQPVRDANPFVEGTPEHQQFQHDYWQRDRELNEVVG